MIVGNEVFGHNGTNDAGIRLSFGAVARDNVVYDNFYGISVNTSTVQHNRVYDNLEAGIRVVGGFPTVSENVIYSNPIGVSSVGNPLIRNNLIYANANIGVSVIGGFEYWPP